MRGPATWAMRILAALVVLGGASGAAAQGLLVIEDVRVIEGTGASTFVLVKVTLQPAPTGPPVTVTWTTQAGSAQAGSDFTMASNILTFNAPSDTEKTFTVEVIGDTTAEWLSQRDEVFFINLSGASNATIQKGRGTVTIVDDDRTMPGVQFLSVVSSGDGAEGLNLLQWRVPAGQPNAPTAIEIRWDKGSSCAFPADTASGIGGIVLTAASPGAVQTYTHNAPLPHDYWCYSVFTRFPTPATGPEIAKVKARTFDAGGALKWTYTNSSALPNVAPPTVGSGAIYVVDNDGVLHAMRRSDTGGNWPGGWNPVALGRIAHYRSPSLPLAGGGSHFFVGTESGEVHAVDGQFGTIVWSRSQLFAPGAPQLMPGSIGNQATPAGLFKAWNGQNDLLLVGTANSASDTSFFALNPATGATIDYYPYGPVGPADTPPGLIRNVYGMAAVDYGAPNRVYFGAAGGGSEFTLWSLDLGLMNSPNLTLSSQAWNPKLLGSGTNGSPVLRGGRLYIGTIDGKVHSLRLADGALSSLDVGGEVKNFMFPDRQSGNLYFSTTNNIVWGVRDDLEPANPNLNSIWFVDDIPNPSMVLLRPGTTELYLGGGGGRLYKIDVASADPKGTKTSVLLDPLPGAIIGAPSLDATHNLILVGSSSGVVYALRP